MVSPLVKSYNALQKSSTIFKRNGVIYKYSNTRITEQEARQALDFKQNLKRNYHRLLPNINSRKRELQFLFQVFQIFLSSLMLPMYVVLEHLANLRNVCFFLQVIFLPLLPNHGYVYMTLLSWEQKIKSGPFTSTICHKINRYLSLYFKSEQA